MLRDRIVALDVAVTQYFTGHTCGLYCEIKGRRGNRAFRAASMPKAAELRERGAASFISELERSQIDALVRQLDALERYRDTGEQDGVENWMLPALMLKPFTVRLATEDALPPGALADAAARTQLQVEMLLGAPIEQIGVTLYRNRATNDIHAISGDWHFDRRPTDWMRAFIYLSDVDADCGPFHYFDKRTSVSLCRQGFKRRSDQWQGRIGRKDGFTRVMGPAGSGLLANAERILHRAGNPAPGRHRDMFEFIFKPKAN